MLYRGRHYRMLVVSITAFSLVSAACNSLRIRVSETVPPEFRFNSGRFAECCTNFRIFAVMEDGSKQTIWRMTSKTVVEKDEANLMVIGYGKVPAGFEQEIPESGEPPPLSEGKTYLAVAGGTDYIPWTRVRFIIRNNKIVELPLKRGELP